MRALILFLLIGSAQAAPSCLPGLYGPQWPGAKLETGVRGQHGWYAYGWCNENDAPIGRYLICTHGVDCWPWDRIGSVFGQVSFEATTKGKEAAFGGWWDANVGADYCANPTGPKVDSCAELKTLLDRDRPVYTPPVAYTHIVAPNPQSTAVPPTRPSRQVVNRAMQPMKSPVYVPTGTNCDLTVQPTFPSGADVWAAVVGQSTDLRWLCRKR